MATLTYISITHVRQPLSASCWGDLKHTQEQKHPNRYAVDWGLHFGRRKSSFILEEVQSSDEGRRREACAWQSFQKNTIFLWLFQAKWIDRVVCFLKKCNGTLKIFMQLYAMDLREFTKIGWTCRSCWNFLKLRFDELKKRLIPRCSH